MGVLKMATSKRRPHDWQKNSELVKESSLGHVIPVKAPIEPVGEP
jgi:hypothetical protein